MDPEGSVSDLPRQKVVFEDYLFYAALQRQEEDVLSRQTSSRGSDTTFRDNEKKNWFSGVMAATDAKVDSSELPAMTEDEVERANASRALRITSWASAFYLITTDVLGPFSAPYAVSQVGWVPGVILYFFSWVHLFVWGDILICRG